MKKLILILTLIFFPVAAPAAERIQERPHWSLEFKGGNFYPAFSDWKQFYGSDKTEHYGAALAYKIIRELEFGIEGGYSRSGGRGVALLHTQNNGGDPVYGGHVVYELYPVNVFVLFRGIVNEDQWLVPYVGGGLTRMYYREKVEYQNTVKGYADGYHARAGVQLLLDNLDRSAANSFYLDSGVFHTYFFLEAGYSRAVVSTDSGSVNLGGKSYLAGLLFEF